MNPINNFTGMANPQVHELSDPSWRKWFDMLFAQTGENPQLADNSVGVKRGMFSAPAERVNTFDPVSQRSAVQEGGRSRQLNAGQPPSVDGLFAATGGGAGSSGWQYRQPIRKGQR